jgi:hypothetical protein
MPTNRADGVKDKYMVRELVTAGPIEGSLSTRRERVEPGLREIGTHLCHGYPSTIIEFG